jgi:hypothetical protein
MTSRPALSVLETRLAAVSGTAADDVRVVGAVASASALIDSRIDAARADAMPDVWAEAVVGLALRLLDAGSRVSGVDGMGFPTPASASAGVWRVVAGLLQPLSATGTVVVA